MVTQNQQYFLVQSGSIWLFTNQVRLPSCLAFTFLAALSSSKSLVVGPSVGPSVRPSVVFVKKWPLEYQKVNKTYFPTYLWDSSESSDSRDSRDSSDSSDSSDNSDSCEKSDL